MGNTGTTMSDARGLWNKIWPRIKHMGDPENGTHANHCIKDIAAALRTARAEGLEEAAQVVENGRFLTNESPEYNFGQKCAAAIRQRAAALRGGGG